MEYLAILIAWWLLSPFLRFFANHLFLSFLLLGIGIFLYRRHRTQPSQSYESSATNSLDHTLVNLLVLRTELARQLAAGTIDSTFYGEAIKEIDLLCGKSLDGLRITPESQRWREGREAAWELLIRQQAIAMSSPPWRSAEKEAQEQLSFLFPSPSVNSTSVPAEVEKPVVLEVPSSMQIPPTVVVPPLSAESVVRLDQVPSIPVPVSVSSSVSDPLTISDFVPVPDSASTDEAWVPVPPNVFERTLQAVSGWPALLVPFLVQNILWFICGLCFVAGSTFLISSTTGQTNALAVSGVLLTYSGFLLWAGYRLCRTRPELTSGRVLLALGILLIPLNIASAVRLITCAPTAPWIAAGLLLTATEVLGFYYATMLVSGVMDRSLQGRHPRLFLVLAAMQMTAPLLSVDASWIPLATTHCALLVVLAYSLRQFTHEWLQSILAERRKVAYYAVGTLVYATVVSFVHLTWGHTNPVSLPAGYYSPFLMIVCGLLFYVDAQLKQWTKQYAFLSRVSFVLYGLSILALLLSVDAPGARLLTLCLAIAVYSVVVWQYVTFTPLVLLFICVTWLYQTLVLQHLPPQWYFLASLPGLIGLLAVSRRFQHRRATTLVSTCCWVWFGTTCATCAWSLFHAHPSLVAMTTALATMGLIFYGLRTAPVTSSEQVTEAMHTDWRQSLWLYAVLLFGSITIAYTPQWLLAPWAAQTASGVVVLAGLWLAVGLQFYREGSQVNARQAEVLFNSVLANLVFALALTATLALSGITHHRILPLLLAATGTVLLWMSLTLRICGLFYGALVLWGATGVVLKLTYFPQPSAGTAEMFIALSVWTLVWWLEHESKESFALRQEYLTTRTRARAQLTLLWQFPIPEDSTYAELLRLPLQQTMVMLWFIGLWHLAARFLEGGVGWGWMCAAGLGAFGALIGAGYFRLLLLIPVGVLLGLGAWLSAVFQFGISRVSALGFAGAFYSALVWSVSIVLLKHPQTSYLANLLHLNGERHTTEASVHWTAVVISLLCVANSVALGSVLTPSVEVFSTLLSVVLFLVIAGWWYQNKIHSYLALGVTILLALLSYNWIVEPPHVSLYSLLHDPGVGLLASVTGLTFWVIAWSLSGQGDRLSAEPIPPVSRLYHDPLCHAALLLAVFAINQALALAWVDTTQGIHILTTTTLFFAGIALFAASSTLRHTSLQIAGLLASVLSISWGETLLIHPEREFTLWPGGSAISDQWLTLSLVSSSLALLVYHLRQQPTRQRYTEATFWAAAITYAWALSGTAMLFLNAPFQADLCVSLTCLTFMISLFPLVQPLAEANIIRGFALPLLGGAFLVSLSVLTGFAHYLGFIVLLWGFILWTAANFALPRWNAQQPQWAVALDSWPWFGLLVVSSCLLSSFLDGRYLSRNSLFHHVGYLIAGAAYSFLMLRNSSWSGFSWIAVFLLTRVGAILTCAWWVAPLFFVPVTSVVLLPIHPPIGELLWLNLLLLVVPWWQLHGDALAARLGWQKHNLPHPFILLPAGFFLIRLSHFALLLSSNGVHRLFPAGEVQWLALVVFAGLLTVSFGHLWWRHCQTWEGHALLAALSCTALVAWLGYVSVSFHFPFFVALWSATVTAAYFLWEKQRWGGERIEPLLHILSQWVEPCLVIATAAFVLLPTSFSEQLITLLMLIYAATVLGWQRQQRRWLLTAGAMILVILHDWPLLWIPIAQISLLWPWYALQMAIVSWLLLWMNQKLQGASIESTEKSLDTLPQSPVILVPLLSWAWQITAGLAVIEWLLHIFFLFAAFAAGRTPQWLNESSDALAALGAAGLLLALGAQQVWRSRKARWVYGVAAFTGVVGFYIRLLLVGLAPASTWDTTAVMVVTYTLFALYHFIRLESLLNVVMLMPLLLFTTIPFQLASSHAGAAFITASALYFITYRETERSLPLYLALAASNSAVYLWIPSWAEQYHVVQLYVAPVALSVLLLAHLHYHELSLQMLNAIRLAATTALYASATSDVFLHQGVGVFIVALALSLAGILLGIAFRVRAFLYTGVASLLCNIGWQLIMLFPEQRLSQAVILLTLAALLAGAMVWFNVQREGILQRVRIFRSDLETWA